MKGEMRGGEGVVERALGCLGRGFDVTGDFRMKLCKGEGRLVALNDGGEKCELVVPGFGRFSGVAAGVKCDKGDRVRLQTDILDFHQMSTLMNERSSLAGKIPNGVFNKMFGFSRGTWAADACDTKCLAVDGYFITLFNLRIDRSPLILSDQVIQAVPSTWQPQLLARFIENYGTHIIVGVSVGGQDVVVLRQDHSSDLPSSELKKHLEKLGDQLFTGSCTLSPPDRRNKGNKHKMPEAFNVFDPQPLLTGGFSSMKTKDGITVICSKRGGDCREENHSEWLHTVPAMPDAINFSFLPITSLLSSVPGRGYLSHAINLYLRYKPPISDLVYFLDIQSHKIWAPVHSDFPLGPPTHKALSTPALQVNLMGPKLYVSTTKVTVGKRPVTGMRLYLEGSKCNRLAVHLQHPANVPAILGSQIGDPSAANWRGSDDIIADESYFETLQWKRFSHVCTAPVQHDRRWAAAGDESAFVVTGAHLLLKEHGSKSVLHLRLLFSKVSGVLVSRSIWERGGPSNIPQISKFPSKISLSISGSSEKSGKPAATPTMIVDSGVFPTGPPVPVHAQKLLRVVDTTEVCKGPQDSPGHWLVTAAKLVLEKGKISLRVEFSLLRSSSW